MHKRKKDEIMAITIQNYLNKNNLSISQISRQTGIGVSTLATAFKKPVENWTIKILNAVAQAAGERPSTLLDKLQDDSYKLEIDNKEQTIQGIKISNSDKFQTVRFAVEANYFEGWKPSKEDIKFLCDYYDNPSPEDQADFNTIWNDNNE